MIAVTYDWNHCGWVFAEAPFGPVVGVRWHEGAIPVPEGATMPEAAHRQPRWATGHAFAALVALPGSALPAIGCVSVMATVGLGDRDLERSFAGQSSVK